VTTAVTCRGMLGSSGLDRCGDLELLGLVQSLPDGSQVRNSACELLVDRYQSLVRSCVRRYRDSPEPEEDLMQVAYVGLFRAIRDFDSEIGVNLGAYAKPCISGEIKRHFRDNRWHVHVRRSAQELRLEIRQARAELTQRLGRMPADGDLARHLDVSNAELLEARRAELAFYVWSLDAPASGRHDVPSLADILGEEDPQLDRALEMQAVWVHFGELPVREQRLLLMRFYGNMSQREIGDRLGISQMHVSRLLSHALGYLRERILGLEADGDAGGGTPAAGGMRGKGRLDARS
jgi:RNA polymerase sigma-B factor